MVTDLKCLLIWSGYWSEVVIVLLHRSLLGCWQTLALKLYCCTEVDVLLHWSWHVAAFVEKTGISFCVCFLLFFRFAVGVGNRAVEEGPNIYRVQESGWASSVGQPKIQTFTGPVAALPLFLSFIFEQVTGSKWLIDVGWLNFGSWGLDHALLPSTTLFRQSLMLNSWTLGFAGSHFGFR